MTSSEPRPFTQVEFQDPDAQGVWNEVTAMARDQVALQARLDAAVAVVEAARWAWLVRGDAEAAAHKELRDALLVFDGLARSGTNDG